MTHLERLQSVLKDGALHIDASQLEGRFMACPHEWAFYALFKREANTPTPGRDYGKFLHKMLAAHYLGRPFDIAAEWAKEPPVAEDDYRTVDYTEQLFKLYKDTYSSEPFSVITVEAPFALPVATLRVNDTAIPVLWTGKVDLVLRMHSDRSLWIMDHKSSKMGGQTFWTQWTNSTQLHGYAWAVQELVEEKVSGYVVNALFVRQPTRTGICHELGRQMFTIEDGALDAWKTNVLNAIGSIGDCLARDHFWRNTSACARRYGMCEYHDICRLSGDRQAILDSNLYRDVTWSPLDD